MNEQKDVPIASKKKMAAILADSFMEVTIGGEKRKIKPLRTYSKYLILQTVDEILHTEKDMESILKEMAGNVYIMSKVTAICLCNHLFTNDDEKNEQLVEQETKNVMLNTTNEKEMGEVIVKALMSLDVETVFQITAHLDFMRKSFLGRKGMTQKMLQEA